MNTKGSHTHWSFHCNLYFVCFLSVSAHIYPFKYRVRCVGVPLRHVHDISVAKTTIENKCSTAVQSVKLSVAARAAKRYPMCVCIICRSHLSAQYSTWNLFTDERQSQTANVREFCWNFASTGFFCFISFQYSKIAIHNHIAHVKSRKIGWFFASAACVFDLRCEVWCQQIRFDSQK